MTVKAMFVRPIEWNGVKKKAGEYISQEEFDSIPVANRKALVSTGKMRLVEEAPKPRKKPGPKKKTGQEDS